MTDEKDLHSKRYFCFKKREVYRALLSVATSFVGALLALAIFAAVHKPPMPPQMMPGNFPPPPPQCEKMKMNFHKGGPDIPPPGEFRGNRPGDFRPGVKVPPPNFEDGNRPGDFKPGAKVPPPNFRHGDKPVNPPAPAAPQKADKK